MGRGCPIRFEHRHRAHRLALPALSLTTALLVLAGCGGGAAPDPMDTTTATTPATSSPAITDCDGPTPLAPVTRFLDTAPQPCRVWVDAAYGRVVNATTGSATVWSRRTEHGTALVVGAVHTLGLGWLGAADTAVSESLQNPAETMGIPRLFLIRSDGSGLENLASPWFGLYNPAIAAERNNNLLHDLLPREDFYVAVADSQKLDVSGLPPPVAPLTRAEVPLYDPTGATTSATTWAHAVAGELVLLVGYPNSSGELTASIGRVLSDDESGQTITQLAALGDVEGDIAYDADVEMMIQGRAVAGMSGGAAFDRGGRLVGILVRATDEHEGVQHVRAVRMSWVVERLEAAFTDLDSTTQSAIADFIEPVG